MRKRIYFLSLQVRGGKKGKKPVILATVRKERKRGEEGER